MVRLIGPTGTESRKPLRKPVRAATTVGGSGAIGVLRGRDPLRSLIFLCLFLVLLFLDLAAHSARDARAKEAVDQVEREKRRQHVIEDFLAKHQNETQAEGGEDGFGERALGAQAERLEVGVFDG